MKGKGESGGPVKSGKPGPAAREGASPPWRYGDPYRRRIDSAVTVNATVTEFRGGGTLCKELYGHP